MFTHPLYSAPYSASPLCLLTPVIPLTNLLQVADQFLIKHLVNFVDKAIGPPVYKPAAKRLQESVSLALNIHPHSLCHCLSPPLSLDLQVTSAGLKSSSFEVIKIIIHLEVSLG